MVVVAFFQHPEMEFCLLIDCYTTIARTHAGGLHHKEICDGISEAIVAHDRCICALSLRSIYARIHVLRCVRHFTQDRIKKKIF